MKNEERIIELLMQSLQGIEELRQDVKIINQRLDRIEHRLDTLEEKVANLEERFNKVEWRHDDLSLRHEELRYAIAKTDKGLVDANHSLISLASQQNRLQTRTERLERPDDFGSSAAA